LSSILEQIGKNLESKYQHTMKTLTDKIEVKNMPAKTQSNRHKDKDRSR
jgi:hypothetical protein